MANSCKNKEINILPKKITLHSRYQTIELALKIPIFINLPSVKTFSATFPFSSAHPYLRSQRYLPNPSAPSPRRGPPRACRSIDKEARESTRFLCLLKEVGSSRFPREVLFASCLGFLFCSFLCLCLSFFTPGSVYLSLSLLPSFGFPIFCAIFVLLFFQAPFM